VNFIKESLLVNETEYQAEGLIKQEALSILKYGKK
jgi:hypothetical protein